MRDRGQSVVAREVRTLRRTLRTLDRSLRRLVPLLAAGMALNARTAGNGHSHPRVSMKARASRVLQGRYMGYVRQLKAGQKAKVRKIREAKGVRAAIVSAKRLVNAS